MLMVLGHPSCRANSCTRICTTSSMMMQLPAPIALSIHRCPPGNITALVVPRRVAVIMMMMPTTTWAPPNRRPTCTAPDSRDGCPHPHPRVFADSLTVMMTTQQSLAALAIVPHTAWGMIRSIATVANVQWVHIGTPVMTSCRGWWCPRYHGSSEAGQRRGRGAATRWCEVE